MDSVLPRVGTCFRNSRGENIAAVWWVDGERYCLQVTVIDSVGAAKSIILDYTEARQLGLDLVTMTAEVVL